MWKSAYHTNVSKKWWNGTLQNLTNRCFTTVKHWFPEISPTHHKLQKFGLWRSLLVTLEPKFSPKARFLRGQILSGKKGFAGVSGNLEELWERGGAGVPIRILRSSRLRGLEAGGWELRRLGSSLEVQKFRRGVSSLEVQKRSETQLVTPTA